MHPFAAFVLGTVVGAAAIVLYPAIAPEVRRHARPTAKTLLKTTLAAAHAVRVQAAEFAEDIEDLVAETQAEMMQERAKAAEEAPKQTAKRPRKTSPRKTASQKRQPANERVGEIRIGRTSGLRADATSIQK